MEDQQADGSLHGALRPPDVTGGRDRLAVLIGRYGKAIEYDLAVRGFDLARLWRSRRWRLLLNLVDHLPRDSFFVEAQADDEDLARHLALLPEPERRERLSDWSPELEVLVAIQDRLGSLISTLVAVNGGEPPRIAPHPRPMTALDQLKVVVRIQQHERLVRRLAPPD